MLQIRLSKGPSAEGGGGGAAAAKPAFPAETVTVACPDHLVLADLPVAKSLGAVTSSAASSVRSVGRRSRRSIGEKVHFCVRCDFPIAIYGRLAPCEHAFCLACARSDPCCYLCDERVLKIQTVKLLEGIFLCAAPHCLKSFLKRSDFELHISESHADLLNPNIEKEGGNETDAMNTTRQSSVDPHKQSAQPESSTAHGPVRAGIPPSTNLQPDDRRNQFRDQPSPKPLMQPRPPPYPSRPQMQQGDQQSENHPPLQGSDKPPNWFQQPQNSESQNGRRNVDQPSQDKQAGIPPESSFSNYPSHSPQPPNYPHPLSGNQGVVSTPFSYSPFPQDGSQPYYTAVPFEMARPGMAPDGGSEQVSVIGIPPQTVMPSFPDNGPRPWGMAMMGVPFAPMQLGQAFPDGFMSQGDPQGGIQFFQGVDYSRMSEGLAMNPPLPGREPEQQTPMQMPVMMSSMLPPPPPTMPRPSLQQLSGNSMSSGGVAQEGQVFGWQNDNRGFGNS